MNQDLNIDLNDYETVLKYKGKIVGSCFTSKLDSINEEFDKELGSYVSSAKGILINFHLYSKTSLFKINDFIGSINELIVNINDEASNNSEIIFSTKTDNTLNEDETNVQVIFTGL